ncbi:MAG: hypothetical protein JW384_02860 [Nitrosomonadaceae bacterium]|nr:hypothetical protein [Nitrosomonadaceae bacterium]
MLIRRGDSNAQPVEDPPSAMTVSYFNILCEFCYFCAQLFSSRMRNWCAFRISRLAVDLAAQSESLIDNCATEALFCSGNSGTHAGGTAADDHNTGVVHT